MSKVYNTQEEIANNLSNPLIKIFNNNIRKTKLNIIPYIILGISVFQGFISHFDCN